MTVQTITTEGGEELVVISRRQYDALLARLGDDDAEDRMTTRMATDFLTAEPRQDAVIPHWFVALAAKHGSPIKAARKHAGLTQKALAARIGIEPDRFRDLEEGRDTGPVETLAAIAAETGADAAWLQP